MVAQKRDTIRRVLKTTVATYGGWLWLLIASVIVKCISESGTLRSLCRVCFNVLHFFFRCSENVVFFFFQMKIVTMILRFYLRQLPPRSRHRPNLFTFYPKLALIQQLNHDWKWSFFALTRNPRFKLAYVNEFLNLFLIQNLTDVQAVGAFSSVLELEILILLLRLRLSTFAYISIDRKMCFKIEKKGLLAFKTRLIYEILPRLWEVK